jgi:hypothetical protein
MDTIEYGAGMDQRVEQFEPGRELWEMTKPIQHWLTPNPASVSIPSGSNTTLRHAARMMPCSSFESGDIRRGSAAGKPVPAPADAGVSASADAGLAGSDDSGVRAP